MEKSNRRGKPLKRHPALIPLSKEHHFGLLLCWKIRRGFQQKVEPERIASYVKYFFEDHLEKHFREEEQYIFPLLGEGNEKWEKAIAQHSAIRELVEGLSGDAEKTAATLGRLEKALEGHIRFEERDLFQYLQKCLNEAELERLRKKIEEVHSSKPEVWKDPFWLV